METQNATLMGGFSLSHLTGPSLVVLLLFAGAVAFLLGHGLYFREVLQF